LFLAEALLEAARLIAGLDAELLRIAGISLSVSLSALLLSSLVSLPLAFLLAFGRFPGRRLLASAFNALMAMPTVVAGLLVYSLLCRRGAFGSFDLLYTPYAMAAGQFVLATPILVSMAASFLESADPRIKTTALTLGATPAQALLAVAQETKAGLLAVLLAGFGRVFAEVGASMMLGGNIRHYTRNITTAIAFETSKGEFSLALALGLILLCAAFLLNAAVRRLGGAARHAL